MAEGFAYQAPDQSVYFSIAKYRASGARYGQLLNLNFDAMRDGRLVVSNEVDINIEGEIIEAQEQKAADPEKAESGAKRA